MPDQQPDAVEVTQGLQESSTHAFSLPGAEERDFTLSRKFYINFSNTPRTVEVKKDSVMLQWYNVPYQDQRFYWTPKTLDEVMFSSELIKVESIGFKMYNFRAAFDVQMLVGSDQKIDAKPTGDPTLWTYIDSKHHLPMRAYSVMKQEEIKSNMCMQKNKNDCELKLWQCPNTYVSSAPSDTSKFFIWPEDMEIVNQEEFKEIPLSGTFSYTHSINTPWFLTSTNVLPHMHAQDKLNAFEFPVINSGRIVEHELYWGSRSFYNPTTDSFDSVNAINHTPFGQPLPDALIRGYPLTTLVDVEVPYTVWGFVEYTAKLKLRRAKWLYGSKRTNPVKHMGTFGPYGLGRTVIRALLGI